jgi:hypothetical protein
MGEEGGGKLGREKVKVKKREGGRRKGEAGERRAKEEESG